MTRSEKPKIVFYPRNEERWNIITHGLGFLLSIAGFVLLLTTSNHLDNGVHYMSYFFYGISLMILFGASTLYHSMKTEKLRHIFNVVDHSAIFLLIAGSYTPFALISLEGWLGWTIFGIVWGLALLGVLFKLFFIGKYKKLSMALYISMGWLVLFIIGPLIAKLAVPGLIYLILGGVLYSIGALFFTLNKIKFNHAIFHVFVLGGSFCHFVSIYWFV